MDLSEIKETPPVKFPGKILDTHPVTTPLDISKPTSPSFKLPRVKFIIKKEPSLSALSPISGAPQNSAKRAFVKRKS